MMNPEHISDVHIPLFSFTVNLKRKVRLHLPKIFIMKSSASIFALSDKPSYSELCRKTAA